MIRRATLLLALLSALALLGPAVSSAAPEAPAWGITITPMPTNFAPGATTEYLLVATNLGAKPTSGQVTLKASLPGGLKPLSAEAKNSDPSSAAPPACAAPIGQSVSCTSSEALNPGFQLNAVVQVEVLGAAGEELDAKAGVEGGGALAPASADSPTPITAEPVPFDFLPGFSVLPSEGDGEPSLLAGSHPYQLTANVGFPTERLGEELTGAGHPRDALVKLPRGLVGNPAATPDLCTEAELTSDETPGCPRASQVGTVEVTSLLGGVGTSGTQPSPLYNMVPPSGAVAELGFNAIGVGIFVHLIAHVDAQDHYRAYTTTNDLPALGSHPIFNVQAQIWGDPSGASHDRTRGKCWKEANSCPVTPHQEIPFLTMPGDCDSPLRYEAFADSWEEPASEFKERETSYEGAALTGCKELKYEPKIESRTTTNLTDSPSGLEFDLHQPQQEPEPEPLEGRATATLRDATVTLPPGLTVNASQASGLEACAESQIGFEGSEEEELRFSEEPQTCPNAAKLGTVEAVSPLLAEYNENHEPERNPETGATIPRPLKGDLYLAQPFANPFGSLVAVYFAVEDEKTGVVAKLAGEGELDSSTGQITVRVKRNPELPIEDIRVHLFGGARGALVTPPTCTSNTTVAELAPWSDPGAPREAQDSFTPARAPGGGACPTSQVQMPNAPVLSAGTVEPEAGKFSPLVFRLSREDGSQRLARVEVSLPPGLTARLAGVAQCPELGIAKAIAREQKPNQGAAELSDPSCLASSEVGSVSVAVGAGPTPFYAGGRAYLAGPYKGAPLSFVIIAPAVAGPFDLGTVVSRVAVYLDPETGRGRAVSDPIPQLVDGVPLDVRKVIMRVDRPNFILNPTSCNELSFSGGATSALGQIAPISERFQVGGCKSLPYKPKLTARLFGPTHRGGHPRLRTVFTARRGDANTAGISFALPKSEFIDQAHFRTICTRVQFAAKQCPAGSVYGYVKATSPLVDYTVEGPIYLRSSSHKLPDVVVALRGPASQPIEIDLDGRVDSINGGIRTTFESVPDLPVSKAIVTLQGGKKGLFQNSTNICKGTHRITLKLNAQNGKVSDTKPLLKAQCGKGKGPKKPKGKGHR
jgi:hypothetical protein